MEEKKISKLAQSKIDSAGTKVSARVLNEVIADWNEQFPELKRFKSGQKLLKKIGPVLIGIELEKYLSNKYRPRFILYNLLDGNNNKLIAVINQAIKNNKGLEVSIEYNRHSEEFMAACHCMENQARIKLQGVPSLQEILDGILMYIEVDCLGNPFWSCEAVMQISRLMDDQSKGDLYFNKALSLLQQKVPAKILEMQVKDVNTWINKMKNLAKEDLENNIKTYLKKHKLEENFGD